MRSKNKPKQTPAESEHADRVSALPCAICEAPPPSQVHEPEQGFWFIAIPLCEACHKGKDGWHGTRLRRSLRKMTELRAINETLRNLA